MLPIPGSCISMVFLQLVEMIIIDNEIDKKRNKVRIPGSCCTKGGY